MRTIIIHPDEQSEESRRRRYSPLYICLCLLCTLLLIGAIVGAILLGIFLSKSDDTDSTTSKNTTRTTARPTSIMTSITTITTTTTTDPPCTKPCRVDQQCVKGVCVGTGVLSFTLTWSRPGDGDIVVKTPDNKFIHYMNRNVSVNTSGGQLDVDDQRGTGPENVFWVGNSTIPPTGTYHVCFAQYNFTMFASITNPITATVKIEKPPNPTETVSKIITSDIDDYYACDSTSAHFITSIDYP